MDVDWSFITNVNVLDAWDRKPIGIAVIVVDSLILDAICILKLFCSFELSLVWRWDDDRDVAEEHNIEWVVFCFC